MLGEKALLVRLSVKHPSFAKTDKAVSLEVADSKNANKKAVKVIKTTIDTTHQSYKGVKTARGKLYNLFASETAPWSEDGWYIIKAQGYDRFTEAMREARDSFDVAVADFLKVYPELVDQAPDRLGDLYDASLFPSVEDCKELFYVDIEVRPVPEAGDFRVAMSADDKQKIATQIQRKNDQRVKEVTTDLFDRTHDVVSNMVQRLEAFDPDKKGAKLYGSLVDNVRDIAELLPSLNVGDDPRLERLAKEIGLRLTEADTATLKKDEGKRKQVTDHAREIMNQIDDFISQ
jgi:hypothetical protein|tara:strand:+ start:14862 stop:15728 length:867 start_codon:yes stop_codon:yes gene_type:complete